MQDIVFLIIKIFFVILAVSVIGTLAVITFRKSKQDRYSTFDEKDQSD